VALEMIKVAHSVFALPFALGSLLLASGGRPSVSVTLWVVVAMVSARSAAMAFNRLVDHRIDGFNPRTRGRALPAGTLSRNFVRGFVIVSCLLFVLAAGMLNPLCLALAPVALAVILGYSYAKRFTVLCHFWLGASLGLTPLAAWIAVTGRVDSSVAIPAALGVAVLFWVAGFDLIYACQDEDFDRERGLHSLPARFGAGRALRMAAACHLLALAALAALGPLAGLGGPWCVAVGVVGLLLAVEHWIAWSRRPEHLRVAFFHVNSAVGLVVLAGIVGDLAWR
jgi:4-hydroxybenzoate polyprenyltransferase